MLQEMCPLWFNGKQKVEKYYEIVCKGDSNISFLQPCFEVFFSALLRMKAGGIIVRGSPGSELSQG